MRPFVAQITAVIASIKSSLLARIFRREMGKEAKNSADRSTRSPAMAFPAAMAIVS